MASTVALIRSRRPDVSQRALRRAQKLAADDALAYYQKAYVPRHFLRTAVNTYPDEYAGTVYLRRRSGDDTRETNRVPLREQLRAIRTKRPLVKTGLTQQIASEGNHSITGRGDKRRMVMRGLPRYFYMNRNYSPGRFHKQKALEAVAPAEAADLINRLDDSLDKHLKT